MNAGQQAGQLNEFFGPGVLGGDTQKLFALLMGSPMWRNMLQQASLQGTSLGQNLTNSFAQRGLTTTGVGTIAQNLGNAAPGFLATQMQGDLWKQALMAAMQNLSQRQGSFTSLEEQRRSKPSFLQSALGGLFGAAGSAIPFLGGAGKAMGSQGAAQSFQPYPWGYPHL